MKCRIFKNNKNAECIGSYLGGRYQDNDGSKPALEI
jgi:hypothetical protein